MTIGVERASPRRRSPRSLATQVEMQNLVGHYAHGRVLLRMCAVFGGLCDHRHVE